MELLTYTYNSDFNAKAVDFLEYFILCFSFAKPENLSVHSREVSIKCIGSSIYIEGTKINPFFIFFVLIVCQ